MARKLLLLIFLFSLSSLNAQIYNENNSLMRKALVLYQKDAKGFYQKTENVSLPVVNNISESYAYDKKSQELYVITSNGNCVITVAENYAKFLKKNKSIPQLKDVELEAAVERANLQLEERFALLNQQRQRAIEDSIAKAKADSIEQARLDSIRLAKIERQKQDYRNAHNWRWVPIPKESLSCSLCDKNIYYGDSLYCVAFRNDTLLHLSREDLALGVTYIKLHPMPVKASLKSNKDFRYHFEIYGDSLRSKSELFDDVEGFNFLSLSDAVEEVKKEAPYGYFNDWNWSSEYGSIKFDFKYTNTNKATIKYIDVYWVVTNDVNDVRKTGHFKGTGPLAEFESASWNWDYSSYYVAGDASHMVITKVILTYTNGTTKTLTKSMLRFE